MYHRGEEAVKNEIFICIDLKAHSWNSCFAFEWTDSFELFHKHTESLKDGFSTQSKRTLGWGVKKEKKDVNTLYKETKANKLVQSCNSCSSLHLKKKILPVQSIAKGVSVYTNVTTSIHYSWAAGSKWSLLTSWHCFLMSIFKYNAYIFLI